MAIFFQYKLTYKTDQGGALPGEPRTWERAQGRSTKSTGKATGVTNLILARKGRNVNVFFTLSKCLAQGGPATGCPFKFHSFL